MKYILIIIILTISNLVFAGYYELKDGDRINFTNIELTDSFFQVDNKNITRDKISTIIFEDIANQKIKNNSSFLANGKTENEYFASNIYELTPLSELKKIISNMLDKHDDSDRMIIKDEGFYTLNNNGTYEYSYHFIGYVHKDKAIEMAKSYFTLDETRRNLKILLARNIQEDGTEIFLSSDNISIAQSQDGIGFVSKNKNLIMTIPNVRKGSIVEYIYKIDIFNPIHSNFFFPGYLFFNGNAPVYQSKITVNIPLKTKLLYRLDNMGKHNFSITTNNNSINYTIEKLNILPINMEPNMLPIDEVVPKFTASIFPDWDQVFKYEKELISENIKITEDIKKLAKTITKGENDQLAQAALLYHWVQKNIRYISIKSGIGSGLGGHPASYTLNNKYGDCIDKSVLFYSLCTSIGIKTFVLGLKAAYSGDMETEIPGFDSNHAISKITLNGKDYFLDTTSSSHRFPFFRGDDKGVHCMNLSEGKFEYIPLSEVDQNKVTSIIKININKQNAMRVTKINHATGDFEAGYRNYWKSVNENQRTKILINIINDYGSNPVLEDLSFSNLEDISKPFEMKYIFTTSNCLIPAGEYFLMDLPFAEADFDFISLISRKHDIYLKDNFCRTNHYEITYPANFDIYYTPEPITVNNNYFFCTAEYKTIPEKNLIYFDYHYYQKTNLIPAADYIFVKNELTAYSSFFDKKIFFKIKKGK